MVIPKALGDQLGLRPGEVELTADGAALRSVRAGGEHSSPHGDDSSFYQSAHGG